MTAYVISILAHPQPGGAGGLLEKVLHCNDWSYCRTRSVSIALETLLQLSLLISLRFLPEIQLATR
jgi:hypothetical protein